MAIINVRELNQSTKEVLDRVARDKEPLLIARRGEAIAAIVPVEASEAERYVLASAPEMLETRRQSEEAGATREARSVESVAAELGIEDDEDNQLDEQSSWLSSQAPNLAEAGVPIASQLGYYVGRESAERVAAEAYLRIRDIALQFVAAAEEGGLIALGSHEEHEAVATRVQELNSELLTSVLPAVLSFTVNERNEIVTRGGPADLEPDTTLADEVLNTATEYLDTVNRSILCQRDRLSATTFSLDAYELALGTGIEALGAIPRHGIRTQVSTGVMRRRVRRETGD